MTPEFSSRSRAASLQEFRKQHYDLLIIGGGITGAAVARDAITRGLKVALIEKGDFASGTSSRSSKLIHGGLRYLENFEIHLVFEALAERAFLLRTVPHMVRPLPFYMPVFKGDPYGMMAMDVGLWLYDLLALFRTPSFHRRLSKKGMLKDIPFLRADGLAGGFRYYDASMWDDVLTVETLRDAQVRGAHVANYVEAVQPVWTGDQISGYQVRDVSGATPGEKFEIRAKRLVVCAGPWTDVLGAQLEKDWKPWLAPSKGVHIIFDLKKIPIPGSLVMSHPEDGRIVFVIPRPDFGSGVVIVGTTDGPAPADPAKVAVERSDIDYLMALLKKYFPALDLKESDILSGYAGIRPLVGQWVESHTDPKKGGESTSASNLQKVSREHHIGLGPGGSVFVAGGKYTTHRLMAREIVDYTLKMWTKFAKAGKTSAPPAGLKKSQTHIPVNPHASSDAMKEAKRKASEMDARIPEELFGRYGADALDIVSAYDESSEDPPGFPYLEGQLRYAVKNGMVLHLKDFYLRRLPLYSSRKDHGLPWAEKLARAFVEELGLKGDEAIKRMSDELTALHSKIQQLSTWN
ncbi:glycerol-3-phosphate dehydrogenase/oxidase [bacterium]|nr:glycerol-3-phosphate dehydrogenase/oxidase [bacterium]